MTDFELMICDVMNDLDDDTPREFILAKETRKKLRIRAENYSKQLDTYIDNLCNSIDVNNFDRFSKTLKSMSKIVDECYDSLLKEIKLEEKLKKKFTK